MIRLQRPGWGALSSSDSFCVVGTWWPAVRAADKQRQRAEPLQSNTAFSATTSPSPKLTLSRRSPAMGRQWCTHKTRAAHRSPAGRRRSSGSGKNQPHTTPSRRSRRASTCSVSPATFRLTLAARAFISGGFMGADRGRRNATGPGTAGGAQASRPRLHPEAGRASSGARSELTDLTPLLWILARQTREHLHFWLYFSK